MTVEFSDLIEMLQDETAKTTQKLYAIEQSVSENKGNWNNELQNTLLKETIDMACAMDVVALALRALNEKLDEHINSR